MRTHGLMMFDCTNDDADDDDTSDSSNDINGLISSVSILARVGMAQ